MRRQKKWEATLLIQAPKVSETQLFNFCDSTSSAPLIRSLRLYLIGLSSPVNFQNNRTTRIRGQALPRPGTVLIMLNNTEVVVSRSLSEAPPNFRPQQSRTISSRFKCIAVYCGSCDGRKPCYRQAAVQLGNLLVEKKIDLVYGGGSIGLMGHVAETVYDGGRDVLGVMPKTLMPIEITGAPVGEVKIVSGMHERKAIMHCKADAFVALPGGYGTLEELLEVTTWAQLGIHQKPVGLLNVDGYYNSLLAFIDNAVEERFIGAAARHIIVSAPTADELMHKLEEYAPQHSGLNWEEQVEVGG